MTHWEEECKTCDCKKYLPKERPEASAKEIQDMMNSLEMVSQDPNLTICSSQHYFCNCKCHEIVVTSKTDVFFDYEQLN